MEGLTITYIIMFFFGIYFLMLFVLLSTKNRKSIYFYPEAKKFLPITVIIPAYNEENTILDTIKAVINMNYPQGKKEIIIVNDGSKDNTRRIVERFIKNRKGIFLLNKPNSGKADSLNQAIKIAKGELIAVVDADSYPERESLRKMVGFFEEDEKVAAVTSRVLVKNRKNLIEKFQDFDYEIIAWDRKILDFINCVYVTNGPLSVYRKRIVQKVGGFDTKNLTEDIEITWNLLSKNYKTKMCYSARVFTSVPDNFRQWNKQRVRWNLGGLQTIFKYKRFFFRGETLFGYFVMAYIFLSFILALIGFIMLSRFVLMKLKLYALSIPLFFRGYSVLSPLEFNLAITLVLLLGIIFTILSIFYYKYIIHNGDVKNKTIFSILIYTFIYRSFYMVPLVDSMIKLIKGDLRWYTK
jgi:cellulose synthase/poly-beta-1,6-N-acetylglucosamine synthase-like glycosyltransferase